MVSELPIAKYRAMLRREGNTAAGPERSRANCRRGGSSRWFLPLATGTGAREKLAPIDRCFAPTPVLVGGAVWANSSRGAAHFFKGNCGEPTSLEIKHLPIM